MGFLTERGTRGHDFWFGHYLRLQLGTKHSALLTLVLETHCNVRVFVFWSKFRKELLLVYEIDLGYRFTARSKTSPNLHRRVRLLLIKVNVHIKWFRVLELRGNHPSIHRNKTIFRFSVRFSFFLLYFW